MSSGIAPTIRMSLYERDGWRCYLCGVTVVYVKHGGTLPANAATLDHVLPRSRGGDDRTSNLRTACSECNGKKAARTAEEYRLGVSNLQARIEASLACLHPGVKVRRALRASMAEMLAAKGLPTQIVEVDAPTHNM